MTFRVKNLPLLTSPGISLRHAALISIAPSPGSPGVAIPPHGSKMIDCGVLPLGKLHIPPYVED